MPRIEFTQFLRPHGRAKPVSIDRPDAVYQKARVLREAGYRFEIEELSTGEIGMDCSRPDDDEPIAMVVCANGPEVAETVDRLVETAFLRVITSPRREAGGS